MIATPGYLNTHGYKDQGTALLDQQPIISASLVPVCQQNPANLMNPYYRFECASINGSQFSAEWPLGDPFSASLMPGEVACSCIAMGSPQPWCAEHDQ
uniref:Uncharacterized protein n=1 Tax=Arundo donax TaxID=35708 RepID=A0A0A8ZLC0_ARUDO